MAFQAKSDKFGLADDTTLAITSCDEGIAAEVVEALGADGSVVASEVFGEKGSPSCSYAVKSSLSGTAAKDIVLGGVTTVNSKHYCLTEVTVSTSAGSAPEVSAKGEEVPSSTASSTYTIEDGLSFSALHIAQILNEAFAISGTGCHLQECSATYSCKFSDATKDGTRLAWDVSEGKIELTATIKKVGTTAPTVTAASGWSITSPLTESAPDADFPEYSVTLTKYLAKDAASA